MDERPPVWVGHVVLYASDVPRSTKWWASLGMRTIEARDDIAVLELRGGTHLLIFPGAPTGAATGAPFDLMVDDIEETRAKMEARGFAPSRFSPAPGDHTTFTLTDPDGYVVTVFNSHVTGPV